MLSEHDCEELEPLRGYVGEMAARFSIEPGKRDFGIISIIINAPACNPQEVDDALKALKNEASPDRNILASFKAIPQGKKIMAQAEESQQGQQHLLEVSKQLIDIQNRCESFRLTVADSTIDSAVQKVAGECTSLRTALQKVKSDHEGSQKALVGARKAVEDFAYAVMKQHAVSGGAPYLSTQGKTLQASRIMSAPQTFSVLGINDLLAKSTVERVIAIDDLAAFYKDCSQMAAWVEGLLKVPTGEDSSVSDELKKVSVELCQGFKSWQKTESRVKCSVPGFEEVTDTVSDGLQAIVNDSSEKVWKCAMAQPIALMSLIVKDAKNHPDPKLDVLRKALASIPDAQLLATGIQNQDKQKAISFATCAAEIILTVSLNLVESASASNTTSHSKACRKMFEFYIHMGAFPRKTQLGLEIFASVDQDALKRLVLVKVLSHGKTSKE